MEWPGEADWKKHKERLWNLKSEPAKEKERVIISRMGLERTNWIRQNRQQSAPSIPAPPPAVIPTPRSITIQSAKRSSTFSNSNLDLQTQTPAVGSTLVCFFNIACINSLENCK